MAWVLHSPQIHSSFSNLGFSHADGYHINENCNVALEGILHNILSEDKVQRTYRRSIRFGQYINKDIIPLLIYTKDNQTLELLIKILVNLSIPVECLLSLETNEKTDVGRHTIYEINSLLISIKIGLTDYRVTKVIIEFLKKNAEVNQCSKISVAQRANICNTLLFLRNVLHIPEEMNFHFYNGPPHKIQNQIIWNLFSRSADKVLLKLITIPDAIHWAVTMVQLIALLYKDQHVNTLHKLLNIWLETSLYESSDDNESNTSPQNRGSNQSSPILTSNPTSDSSDNAGRGKSDEERNSTDTWESVSGAGKENNYEKHKPSETGEPSEKNLKKPSENETNFKKDGNMKISSGNSASTGYTNYVKEQSQNNENDNYFKEFSENRASSENDAYYKGSSENSANSKNDNNTKGSPENDLLASESANTKNTYPEKRNKWKKYFTNRIVNQETTTTSSNEDELSNKNQHKSKSRANLTAPERRRKKIVKRGKLNIINANGVTHMSPTDDNISNLLKEFTIEFLFKGFNSLVQTLHRQIISNVGVEIDTSHFFWLVTYFLKFATQIELDIQHLSKVLSFDIISYLTAEGVNLCEQFELIIKLDGNDLKPCVRRLHLAVAAIREFIRAIEVYKKSTKICKNGKEMLLKLQMQMSETDQLRSVLVLLLRHFNPAYQTKQYLQDIIVTNHLLLMCLDTFMQSESNGTTKMVKHIRQFSTPEIMHQYGLLLEDFEENGKFVNDCVFTMMYHVAGEMDCLQSLVQPGILKTFTSIRKSEFEICDDWSDIIEYAINAFVENPHKLHLTDEMLLDIKNCEDTKHKDIFISTNNTFMAAQENKKSSLTNSRDRWSEHELSSLNWYYMQCKTKPNVIGEIANMFKENGIVKTNLSIVRELLRQHIVSKEEYDTLRKYDTSPKVVQETKKLRDYEIGKLCDQLAQDGKVTMLNWLHMVLLDTCYAKIYLEKSLKTEDVADEKSEPEEQKHVVSPVSYHAMLFNQSVPLIPWNCQQAAVCKDLKFLQLLNKLGFQMPVDTGRVFIRIPSFWTADFLYEVAGKIAPINPTKLKFSLSDISQSSVRSSNERPWHDSYMFGSPPSTAENFAQVQKERNLSSILNFTPMPGSSFHAAAVNKPNWLELVQRSQEYNITLDLERSIVETNKKPDAVEQFPRSPSPPPPAPFALSPAPAPSPSPVDLKADFECCNNSACETASVASDLTRMYVSDEDEKSDHTTSSDPEYGPSPKRARLEQLLTPF